MLKVAYICSSLIRKGPTNVLYNLLSSFESSQVLPIIITISAEEKDSRKPDFDALGVKIICLNLSRGIDSYLRSYKLAEVLESIKPDICHSSGFRTDILCFKELRKKYKIISSLYNFPIDDYGMQYGKIAGTIMAKIHFSILSNFTKVITCSKFILDKLSKYDNISAVLIYTGVDRHFFKPPTVERYNDLRKQYGINMNTIVYIFIANLIPRKNPQILVEAFADIIKKTNKNIHLFMMGDGPLMDECKSIYNGNNITYLGNQPDTRLYLEASDFYVSPSLSEGFPTAVLEALSVGIPCILSDILPHKEMLHGIKDAMLFKVENIDSLKEQFLTSFEIELDIEKKRAREYFVGNFSSEIMAKNHLKTYKEILS